MSPQYKLSTAFTKMFGITQPIALAGMASAAGPALAAAVTNAGGIGVIGGLRASPEYLRSQIRELKDDLKDKNAPFGIDLLLPQVGGNARKTNYDYTGGQLSELIQVIIEEKAAFFVCAVGVPPREVVDALHKANIPIMNMIGHVKHVQKALDAGVDIICAQGGEGGGHTGNISSMILWPSCLEAIKGKSSPLTGKPIQLVAAGGIHNGRGVAAALSMGCSAVWVGTAFVVAEEAGASAAHQQEIISAGYDDTIRSLIYTGRPLRVKKTPVNLSWDKRQDALLEITGRGILPVDRDIPENRPYLMGQVAGALKQVRPAAAIMDDMINEAGEYLQYGVKLVSKL